MAAIILPKSDDLISTWVSTPPGTYYTTVDDTEISDEDYISTPLIKNTTTPPIIFGLQDPLINIGMYYVNIRARASIANVSRICVTLLDDNYNAVSASVWITLTSTDFTSYKVVLTNNAVATKIKLAADDLLDDDAKPIEFVGTVPDYVFDVNDTVAIDLSTYFIASYLPVTYELSGTLPEGVAFDTNTGVISGIPLDDIVTTLQVIGRDSQGYPAASNSFSMTVIAEPVVLGDYLDTFTGPSGLLSAHTSDSGHTYSSWGGQTVLDRYMLDGNGNMYVTNGATYSEGIIVLNNELDTTRDVFLEVEVQHPGSGDARLFYGLMSDIIYQYYYESELAPLFSKYHVTLYVNDGMSNNDQIINTNIPVSPATITLRMEITNNASNVRILYNGTQLLALTGRGHIDAPWAYLRFRYIQDANPIRVLRYQTGYFTPGGDPHWNNVALLINADGTEGSTSIVDKSKYATTQTANGGAGITLTDPDFPLGCIAFDGTDDFVVCPHVAARDAHTTSTISTTTNWTFEFDIKLAAINIDQVFVGKGLPLSGGSGDPGWRIKLNNNGTVNFAVGVNTPAIGAQYVTTTSLPLNVKTHVAVEITKGVPSIAFNGVVQPASFTYGDLTSFKASSASKSSYSVDLGCLQTDDTNTIRAQFLKGKMARIRETTGISRYGGVNFTPPVGLLPTD